MAIQVTHPGTPPDETFRGTCYSCGCRFTCAETDGTYSAGDQREGPMVTLPCPTCGKSVTAYRARQSGWTAEGR